MTKKKTAGDEAMTQGVRIVGFDLRLHRGMRSVAADLGIPVRALYEQVVRAHLIQVGKLAA